MTGHKTNAEIVLGQRCVCAMRLQLMHNARYTAINCGQLNQHKYKLLADTASGRGVWARGVVVGPPQRNVPKYPLKQLNALTAKRIDKWQSATLLPATFPSSSSSSSAETLPTPTAAHKHTHIIIIIIIVVVVVTIIRSLSSFGALQNANASLARHGAFGFCA